jgi:hypothetical protein
VKIGEASPKGRMDMPMGRGGGGGNMRMLSGGQGGGFPAQNFDAHFGPMGFGGAQGFAGEPYLVPVLWIRIRIRMDLLQFGNRIRIKVISLIRNRIWIRISLQMTSQNVWNLSLFEHFLERV